MTKDSPRNSVLRDEELIKWLREPVMERGLDEGWIDSQRNCAADRIEALVRKLAWTEAKLEAEELTSGLKLNEANARAEQLVATNERLEAALRLLHDNVVLAFPALANLGPVANARAALSITEASHE